MQDRYSGDVGDFGKFGLLRHLLNDTGYSLGVNWYLFPNEDHNKDGRYINYLSNFQYQQCDNELHKKLQEVVSNSRCIISLENANIFNCETTYYSCPVDFYPDFPRQTKNHKEQRLQLRHEWQKRAISKLLYTNVLFLDPDNGLQIDSCKALNLQKSGKFAYFDEISKFHQGKEFTVIYHHLNRRGTHERQILHRAQELKQKINPEHTVFHIRYIPYSSRAFFIVASQKVTENIRKKLDKFLESNWVRYWDCYGEL